MKESEKDLLDNIRGLESATEELSIEKLRLLDTINQMGGAKVLMEKFGEVEDEDDEMARKITAMLCELVIRRTLRIKEGEEDLRLSEELQWDMEEFRKSDCESMTEFLMQKQMTGNGDG